MMLTSPCNGNVILSITIHIASTTINISILGQSHPVLRYILIVHFLFLIRSVVMAMHAHVLMHPINYIISNTTVLKIA